MKNTILNYALTYIDCNGKEVLISSNGEEITLEGKPFYVSRENAVKKQKNIVNNIRKHYLSRYKHWYDKALAAPAKELKSPEGYFLLKSIKTYEDALLIIENGLNIVEVEISVELKG